MIRYTYKRVQARYLFVRTGIIVCRATEFVSSRPLLTQRGGHTRLGGRGGGPNSDDWTASLTFCILGVFVQKYFG